MHDHFDLAHYWAQGDAVSHAVALLLALLSVASWAVAGAKAWQFHGLRRRGRPFLHALLPGSRIRDAHSGPEPYGRIARDGHAALLHHQGQAAAAVTRGELVGGALRQAIQASARQLESGLSFLASVGATAPFIGLFGTVWGIYHALAAIGASGQASLDQVAGPVGEALIMTAAGLLVAIPAVLAYNLLARALLLIEQDLQGYGFALYAHYCSEPAAAGSAA
ncbi:MAG: MotA/TolQ/ExbB proton channel family protein [Rhodocyclaceae bacterium]|nr:MotA/TolQ/ExbB proton channel family protein [Rhodocyclaceae bacterium]